MEKSGIYSICPVFVDFSNTILSRTVLIKRIELKFNISMSSVGFPGGSECKESACHAGDLGSVSELGRSPGEGNGNPLQNPCLENPMDRGVW